MTHASIEIRNYHESDFNSVIAIFDRNVPTYFAESERDDLVAYLRNEREIYLVAEIENTILGTAGINFENEKKMGVISWDIIEPTFQRKGIGSVLMNYRLELLQSMDSINEVSVRTSQQTFKFYEKFGFKTQRIEKDYWARGFDLYEMILLLK